VFDGTSNKLIKADVLVEGNLIKQISKEPLMVTQTDNVTIIDGKGSPLMPGLIDSHQHLSQGGLGTADLYFGNLYFIGIAQSKLAYGTLMRGVTSVRDPAGDSFGVKRAIDEGMVPGPRIVASGPGIGPTNGHGDFRFPYSGHKRFDDVGVDPGRRANLIYTVDTPLFPFPIGGGLKAILAEGEKANS